MSDSFVRVQNRDGIDPVLEDHYDLLIGALGFEQRSMFIPELVADRCARVLVPEFDINRTLMFERNQGLASRLGFEHPELRESQFEACVRRAVIELREGAPSAFEPRVLVDVSSMTRVRMARSLAALREELPTPSIVDVAYAPAKYSESLGEDGPVSETGSLPHFAGWGGSPDIELGMVLGLGFESHLTLGVVETHEPADIWCFIPSGIDGRYDDRVARENALLLERVPSERVITYDVLRPFATAETLQGILRVTMTSHRMMVVPLGAKAFCVSTLTVALAYANRLNVWRVSSGRHRIPADREAIGAVCAIRLRLERSPPEPVEDEGRP